MRQENGVTVERRYNMKLKWIIMFYWLFNFWVFHTRLDMPVKFKHFENQYNKTYGGWYRILHIGFFGVNIYHDNPETLGFVPKDKKH
jgi:hypothetical protein